MTDETFLGDYQNIIANVKESLTQIKADGLETVKRIAKKIDLNHARKMVEDEIKLSDSVKECGKSDDGKGCKALVNEIIATALPNLVFGYIALILLLILMTYYVGDAISRLLMYPYVYGG